MPSKAQGKTTLQDSEALAERAATSDPTDTPSEADIEAARVEVGTLVPRNEQAMQTFMGWMVEKASGNDDDTYAVMAQIVAEILASESPAEVLTEKSVLHAKELVGVPLILHGFDIREGSFEDSLTGHYASMTVGRAGMPDTRIVTCGGIKVLAKLMKLDEFGEWPQVFWFTAKQTGKGNTVLDIVSPQ